MELKDKIRHYRKLKKYTQKELSDLTGISTSSITKYESGERFPKLENIRKMEDALDFRHENVKTLIYHFNRANDLGKDRIIEYAEIISDVDRYKK